MSELEQHNAPCCGVLKKVLLAVAVLSCAGGLAYAFWPSEPAPQMQDAKISQGPSEALIDMVPSVIHDPKVSEDDRMSQTILGDWVTDRSSGHRELTVKDDGTAKMNVTVTNWMRFAFGPKIEVDIEWEIKDGVLHFDMVGGKPERSIQALKSGYGESLAYPILEVTETRLLVKDGGEDPDHDWARPD